MGAVLVHRLVDAGHDVSSSGRRSSSCFVVRPR
ncbi:hypothetical protein [Kutzneria buriramensis]